MKNRFLKILISTSFLISFSGTAVLAHSNSTEVIPAENTVTGAFQNEPDLQKTDTNLNSGSGDHDDRAEADQETESASGNESNVMLIDVIASGSAGVNWWLDSRDILHFEAGKLNRDDSWKYYSGRIREIRVVPTNQNNKLFLPEDSSFLFSCLTSLTEIDTDKFDTTFVTSMFAMFESCTSLKKIDLSGFHTRNVTNMRYLFSNCDSLTAVKVSSFDRCCIEEDETTFYHCSGNPKLVPFWLESPEDTDSAPRNKDLDAESANSNEQTETNQKTEQSENTETNLIPVYITASGTAGTGWHLDQTNVLYFDAGELNRDDGWKEFASSIREIRVIPNKEFSKLILPADCEKLFEGLSSLTYMESARIDASQITSMTDMLNGCTSLKSLDLFRSQTLAAECADEAEDAWNPKQAVVTGTAGVDWYIDKNGTLCFQAGYLDRNDDWKNYRSWIDEIKVIPNHKYGKLILPYDSSLLFSGLSSLTHIETDKFDTSSVSDLIRMFLGCTSLKNLDLSSFDTSSVVSMFEIFNGCTSLQSLDLSSFDTSKTDGLWAYRIFDGCCSLQEINFSKKFFNKNISAYPGRIDDGKWVQLSNHRKVKFLSDLIRNWDAEDYGWWRRISESSVLTFNSNGGTDFDPVNKKSESCIDLSQYTPSRPGYNFTGWYFDPDCTDQADSHFTLNTDTTLYAGWQIQNVTLTFETYGHWPMKPVTVRYGETVDLRYYVALRRNCHFTGWFMDPEHLVEAENKITLTSDTTVYAGWGLGPELWIPPDDLL
ncbi:MAG: BspA family leucine-rich repeat surface protein [Erysipelotrichaceae bacterium]|nr:BspA family leucine-rich repeat surface protein [Erysipelotrichaceae bacterium]